MSKILEDMYNGKLSFHSQNNFDTLVNQIHKQDPEMQVVNNYDRTIYLTCDMDNIDNIMKKAMTKYIKNKNIIPYMYTVMQLSQNKLLIRL